MSVERIETESMGAAHQEPVILKGEISRMPVWAPIRVLMTVTGLILVQNLLKLMARYLLAIKGQATATVRGANLTLTAEWSVMGRRIRRVKTTAPIRRLDAVRFENRQRYLHLLVAFGCLVVGTLVGMQWFLDGLRAGYPYLVLVGAAIVAAGIALDLVLYLLIPAGRGRSHLVLSLGPWTTRLIGVDTANAERFLEQVESGWRE